MPRKKRSASPFELMDDDFDDNSSQSSRNGNPPIQRNAANARERARMRVLSSAFGRLKTKLPNIPADTKLSKLDTLRLATMYIKQLKTVVEGGGGSGSSATNDDIMEGSLLNNNGSNNATHNYLNLNTGVQSMNWPFGFHHHLTNSSLIRSSSTTSLTNNNSSHNNWTQNGDQHTEDQLKPLRYDHENYEHNHHHHQQEQQQQTAAYVHHTTLNQQQQNNQPNHWYSETPSPELDSTSSTCLTFENSHLLQQTEQRHHHQQQQQLNSQQQHHHHHNLTHLQSESTHSSSTFQMQHDFHHLQHHHHHQQHHPSQLHNLHQNTFVNSSNFQSTSIR